MAVIRLHCFSQNLSHRLSKQASNGNDGSRVPPSPFEDYYCTGRCLLFWARSIYPTAARRERQAILRALGGIGSRDHHNHSMFGGHAVRAGRRSHYRNSKIARESSYLAACLERSLDVRRQRISNLLSGIPDLTSCWKGLRGEENISDFCRRGGESHKCPGEECFHRSSRAEDLGKTKGRGCAPDGQQGTTELYWVWANCFAKTNAPSSSVSSAIFCASMTSPATR